MPDAPPVNVQALQPSEILELVKDRESALVSTPCPRCQSRFRIRHRLADGSVVVECLDCEDRSAT